MSNTKTDFNGQVELTVKQIESTLSNYNKKTFDFHKFTDYVIQKNLINQILYKHYENYLFRKLKFNHYTNSKKSESKMIRNFKEKFGKPKDVLVFLGDFDKSNNHMAGVEPVICKRFRKIFKRGGYKVYLVNEHKTSCICHNERNLPNFVWRNQRTMANLY